MEETAEKETVAEQIEGTQEESAGEVLVPTEEPKTEEIKPEENEDTIGLEAKIEEALNAGIVKMKSEGSEAVHGEETSESEDDFSSFVASEFSSVESSESNFEEVQSAADDVLSYLEKIIYEMDVDASLEVSHNRRNIIIQIETDQPGRVIGYHGRVLKSLQLLAQNYVYDRHSKRSSVVLNVRDYLEQRTETLINLAEKIAAKVKETGREYVMDPMTNSERKIIHKYLSQIEGVESHSEGDDPNRYVVVTKV